MNKKLLNLAAVAFLTGLLSATASAQVVVTVGALDLNAQFNSSAGTAGVVSAPVDTVTATHTFTVTDLDIAEDGTANDVAVFSYDVAATNGNIGLVAGTAFAYGVDGTEDPADNEIDLDEGLSFSNLDAVVTFGDPTTETLNVVSAEFNFFQARFPGGGDIVLLTDGNGGSISITSVPDGGGNDPYIFEFPQTAFSVVSGGGNGFGIDTINATFTLQLGASSTLLGDVNLDTVVDFSDIAPFIDVLSNGGDQAEADCNEDGFVDFSDISFFIDILSGN